MSTAIQFRRMNVANGPYINADMISADYNEGLIMFSAIGYDTAIKEVAGNMVRNTSIYINSMGSFTTGAAKKYEVYKTKDAKSDYAHVIAMKKDEINPDGRFALYFVLRNSDPSDLNDPTTYTEELKDAFFNKVYQNTPVPLLKEWVPYLMKELYNGRHLRKATRTFHVPGSEFTTYILRTDNSRIFTLVSDGLRRGFINVNGSNSVSETMSEVVGMDDYLNAYSGILADRIQNSFQPKFVPGESEYNDNLKVFSDYTSYKGVDLYEAQKAVMQASSNNLDKNGISFIIGEMGTGKFIAVLRRDS